MAIALKNGALYQEVLEKTAAGERADGTGSGGDEEERKRISRELHDGVAQSFLGVVYLSEFALDSLEKDLGRPGRPSQPHGKGQGRIGGAAGVITDLRPIPLSTSWLAGSGGEAAQGPCCRAGTWRSRSKATS